MRRYKVTVTTAADGTVTAYTPRISGRLHSVSYVKPGAGSFTDGVDFTITRELTGESVWTEANVNASASRYPRVPTQDGVGAASLFAAGGEPVETFLGLGNERVKIVLASGGNAKTGDFHFLVD